MKKRRTHLQCNVRRIDLEGSQAERRLLRIALVADLHDRPCCGLTQAIRDAQPDRIAVAGDRMPAAIRWCAPRCTW